jgi:hypothetical protein
MRMAPLDVVPAKMDKREARRRVGFSTLATATWIATVRVNASHSGSTEAHNRRAGLQPRFLLKANPFLLVIPAKMEIHAAVMQKGKVHSRFSRE